MSDIVVRGPDVDRSTEILTPEALAFVADLQRRFGGRRDELLAAAAPAPGRPGRGAARWTSCPRRPRSAPATGGWRRRRADLLDRRVEITGPTERKMAINALNSGAQVWLADLEDANTPHWANVVGGQVNLYDAVRRHHHAHLARGQGLRAARRTRSRRSSCGPAAGTSTSEHLLVDGAAGRRPRSSTSGSTSSTTPRELLARGSGPVLLPAQAGVATTRRSCGTTSSPTPRSALGLPHGTVRATVLIETITAAFEMEEILYALRDHVAGLNAGRWDYLFSIIKNFRDAGPTFVLPDRNAVTMTAPFMRAYTELLVATCHRRGAFAIGGMAAFIPSRRDAGRQRARASPRCATTRPARPTRRLRRLVGRAPGPRRRCARRSSTRVLGRPPATSSTGSATTSRSRPTTCSASTATPGVRIEAGPARQRQRRHRVPRTPGCPATARSPSAT